MPGSSRIGSPTPRSRSGGRIGRDSPDLPDFNDLIADVWGTGSAIPAWPEDAGLTAKQLTINRGLFIQSGRHDPDVVFTLHDYAYDNTQELFASFAASLREISCR
jgi:hypothetical protein